MNARVPELLHVPWMDRERLKTSIVAVNLFVCNEERIRRGDQKVFDEMVGKAGFGLLGSSLGSPDHQSGFSYGANLMESGFQVHTWPELDMSAQVVLHYCDYSRDNSDKAKHLIDLVKKHFSPRHIESLPAVPFPL